MTRPQRQKKCACDCKMSIGFNDYRDSTGYIIGLKTYYSLVSLVNHIVLYRFKIGRAVA